MTLAATKNTFQIVRNPDAPPAGLAGAVLAIGNFDGVHRGHKAVIGHARALAQKLGRPCAVLTFDPHPADFFAGKTVVNRITPVAAQGRALERLDLDGVIVFSFDAQLAALSAEEFINEVIIRRLGAAGVVVGYDFHFGKRRTGTPALLQEAGERHGFAVEIVGKVTSDAAGSLEPVHSSAVRKALAGGDVAFARQLLGHDFFVVGDIIHGQKLGRTLGFPTANLQLDPSMQLAFGIYAVRVGIDGRTYNAVASYGRRPTVDNGAPLLEVYVLDFSGDLYGKTVEVAFIEWIRPELKFDGLEPLVAQIRDDEAKARAILARAIPAQKP